MSKRIVMSVLFSLVVAIVSTVGSFTMKSNADERVMLIIEHPDSCMLTDPQPLYNGMSAGATIVSVKPGPNTFSFDCDGKQATLHKDVASGETRWKVDPMAQ